MFKDSSRKCTPEKDGMKEAKIERNTPNEMPLSLQALPIFSMMGLMFVLPFIRRFR